MYSYKLQITTVKEFLQHPCLFVGKMFSTEYRMMKESSDKICMHSCSWTIMSLNRAYKRPTRVLHVLLLTKNLTKTLGSVL